MKSKHHSRHVRANDYSPQQSIIYGKNAIYEALRAGARKVHKVLFAVGANDVTVGANNDSPLRELIRVKNCPVEQVTRAELDRMTQGAVHQGCVAKVGPYPEYALFECFAVGANNDSPQHKKLVLIVDCVQDPQNFGTLCRSALAFGVREVIIPKDRSVTITPAVCKASSGAVEHLKIITVTNLARAIEELKKHGFWVYGASLDPKLQSLTAITPAEKSAIVVGSEGQGLRRLVAESCDVLVKIPMAVDFDSLNVAQAGTVMMWEFWGKMSPKTPS